MNIIDSEKLSRYPEILVVLTISEAPEFRTGPHRKKKIKGIGSHRLSNSQPAAAGSLSSDYHEAPCMSISPLPSSTSHIASLLNGGLTTEIASPPCMLNIQV